MTRGSMLVKRWYQPPDAEGAFAYPKCAGLLKDHAWRGRYCKPTQMEGHSLKQGRCWYLVRPGLSPSSGFPMPPVPTYWKTPPQSSARLQLWHNSQIAEFKFAFNGKTRR